jgi:hypothetical protein
MEVSYNMEKVTIEKYYDMTGKEFYAAHYNGGVGTLTITPGSDLEKEIKSTFNKIVDSYRSSRDCNTECKVNDNSILNMPHPL